eukprot:2555339-Rhodomonas_salina.1
MVLQHAAGSITGARARDPPPPCHNRRPPRPVASPLGRARARLQVERPLALRQAASASQAQIHKPRKGSVVLRSVERGQSRGGHGAWPLARAGPRGSQSRSLGSTLPVAASHGQSELEVRPWARLSHNMINSECHLITTHCHRSPAPSLPCHGYPAASPHKALLGCCDWCQS